MDCTRYKVLSLYKRRTAENTLIFLDEVMDRMPFPIQRIQTDRGQEFFAYEVQQRLKEYGIKFRPIKPASPHLKPHVSYCTSFQIINIKLFIIQLLFYLNSFCYRRALSFN